MATVWSLDFCLVCDRQTLGGPYCSQKCRLAELDQSSESEPSSPGIVDPQSSGKHHNYYASYQPMRKASNGHSISSTPFPPRGALSPSSSQSSLSSLRSSSSQSGSLSDKALTELRDYANCFDQVRDWKRRLTNP